METNGQRAGRAGVKARATNSLPDPLSSVDQHCAARGSNRANGGFEFSIGGLLPMMLSRELREAASRFRAKFSRCQHHRLQSAAHGNFELLQQAGAFVDVIKRSAFYRLHRGFVIFDCGNKNDEVSGATAAQNAGPRSHPSAAS